ncbi:hypothetical protein POM88_002540 [Heracleum sosnowskyi]|uniref:Uncharacterized protein n=1 Tax=Heracleum sosnowskyi TaxID=360622 RepID=A0AAD8JE64_9APIA|nr:hypothetical protein POM88_002540 [Heracleum sosnowskyi]
MIKRGLDFYLQPQLATRVRIPPAAQNHQVTASTQTQTQVDEPASPTASTSSGGVEEDMVKEKDTPEVPASPAPVAAMTAQKSTATQSITGSYHEQLYGDLHFAAPKNQGNRLECAKKTTANGT